jgi:integrase
MPLGGNNRIRWPTVKNKQACSQKMRKTLTDAAIRKLKPPTSGSVDYYDRACPGLALRISYGGAKAWSFTYRHNGVLRRMTLGRYPLLGLAEARQAWIRLRQDVAHGKDPLRDRKIKRPSTAYSASVEEWLERDQAGNRSRHVTRRVFERDVLPTLGDRDIADVGRRDVLDVLDAIVDRGAPVMARRTYGRLNRFFNWCVGRGIIEVSPMVAMPRPGGREKGRERVLADAELAKVWRACDELGWPYGPCVQLLALTGARRGEIGALRWDEIVDDAIVLAGDRTKTSEPHSIPLSPMAAAIVAELPKVTGSPYVFSLNGKAPIANWGEVKKKLSASADIAPWVLHDIRRTVATGLQKLGVQLQVTEAVLGHVGSRGGVVGVYQRHGFEVEKRASLEAWGAHIAALIEGRRPGTVVPLRKG